MSDLRLLAILENIDKLDAAKSNAEFSGKRSESAGT